MRIYAEVSMMMAAFQDYRYEVNENGDRVVVKSLESTKRAYLRFSNLTSRPVDVWWRDFRGIRQQYARLKPRTACAVDSYITHAWEFTDADTDERYCVRNKYIFRAPEKVGGMMYRTNWNITVPVRTLHDCALLALAERIPQPELVAELELPRNLQVEVENLVKTISAKVPVAPSNQPEPHLNEPDLVE